MTTMRARRKILMMSDVFKCVAEFEWAFSMLSVLQDV